MTRKVRALCDMHSQEVYGDEPIMAGSVLEIDDDHALAWVHRGLVEYADGLDGHGTPSYDAPKT